MAIFYEFFFSRKSHTKIIKRQILLNWLMSKIYNVIYIGWKLMKISFSHNFWCSVSNKGSTGPKRGPPPFSVDEKKFYGWESTFHYAHEWYVVNFNRIWVCYSVNVYAWLWMWCERFLKQLLNNQIMEKCFFTHYKNVIIIHDFRLRVFC